MLPEAIEPFFCTIGHDPNANKIWKLNEMYCDKATYISNSQMYCKDHSSASGNYFPLIPMQY